MKKMKKKTIEDFDPCKVITAGQQLALYNKYKKLNQKLQPNMVKNNILEYIKIQQEMSHIRMTLNLLGLNIEGVNQMEKDVD